MPFTHSEAPHPPFFPFIQVAPSFSLKRSGYNVWREHGTNDWLLKYTVSGGGRFGFQNGVIYTSPGDAVLITPGVRHDYGVAVEHDTWGPVWSHFRPRPHWLDWLDWPEVTPGLRRLRVESPEIRERIRLRFLEVSRLARSDLLRREDWAMNALEEVLLLLDGQNERIRPRVFDPRIRIIIDHIRQHLGESLTRPSLARLCGLSESRLSHLFHEETGSSLPEFIEFVRVDKAKQNLELSDQAITEISTQLGFDNAYYFSRRFKVRTGMSPSDYRLKFSVIHRVAELSPGLEHEVREVFPPQD